ncbi:MAG: GC-type dockerin domain-anchored protein [Phycisphaerales bacterium]
MNTKPFVAVCAVALAGSVALAQPANDSCSTPESLSGFGQFAFDNNLSTTDGSAATCGDIFNDVWFCWTPSEGGPTIVRTCNLAAFDTKIAVYLGCGCPGSESIACNDDSCGLQSSVGFNAELGQTYMIRLGAFSATGFGAGSLEIASGIIAGPISNSANGHEYLLYEATDWNTAESTAVALGGHLVTINDADENLFVNSQVLGFDGADRRAWIGFTDAASPGDYAWISGEPVTYTNWNPGEPNNIGVESYTEMLGSSGEWNNVIATHAVTRFAIAERGPSTPTCIADVDDGSGEGTPDGAVTIDDLLFYITIFQQGAVAADVDNGTGTGTTDGAVTIDDLLYFLSRFQNGC